MGQLTEVSSQNTLPSIIEKLPVYQLVRFQLEILQWQIYKENHTFLNVVDFVKEATNEATHPAYGALATNSAKDHATSSARSHIRSLPLKKGQRRAL